MNSYFIERTCSNCGFKEKLAITKREAAFELVDINRVLGKTCKNCSSESFEVSFVLPELDLDLLEEWAINSELLLMPQDEELLLADEKYVDMIVHMLDTIEMLNHKRDVLMDALCIIVYDNSADNKLNKDVHLRDRVIEILNKRQEQLRHAENWIMDYVKDVVFPQLDHGIPRFA